MNRSRTSHPYYIGKRYIDDRLFRGDPKASPTRPQDCVLHSELPETTRIIRADTICTQDLKADRLNLHLDASDKVIKQAMG